MESTYCTAFSCTKWQIRNLLLAIVCDLFNIPIVFLSFATSMASNASPTATVVSSLAQASSSLVTPTLSSPSTITVMEPVPSPVESGVSTTTQVSIIRVCLFLCVVRYQLSSKMCNGRDQLGTVGFSSLSVVCYSLAVELLRVWCTILKRPVILGQIFRLMYIV